MDRSRRAERFATELNGNRHFTDDPNTGDTNPGDPPIADRSVCGLAAVECLAGSEDEGAVITTALRNNPRGDVNHDCDIDTPDLPAAPATRDTRQHMTHHRGIRRFILA
jgi:hypothetical protein